MSARITALLFIIVGIINLYPTIGVLGVSRLFSLYGVPLDDVNLLLLMRHRAVLFGIVGGMLLYAAFTPQVRPLATVVGLVSMVSFVLLMLGGEYNDALRRIFVVDIVASVLLVIAFVLDTVRLSP